ncbi:putative staphylococcal-like nuclease CAN1 [Bidens hawaiensis]|uniref:putative staphylococcal-like nuclease CAN1 n=1 Tax=Bidens hawaiensis TaxID=980011 RepID=UPI00404A85E6
MDRYGHCVSDVHDDQELIQVLMLKEGAIWWYEYFDDRNELKQDFLDCYGFPKPTKYEAIITPTANGVLPMFSFRTYPVNGGDIPDGDGLKVSAALIDLSQVPTEVYNNLQNYYHMYRFNKTYKKKVIIASHRISISSGKAVLPHSYDIPLRYDQEYGDAAKQVLQDAVVDKCLLINVYYMDRYGRCVSDVYDDQASKVERHWLAVLSQPYCTLGLETT